MGLRQSLSSGLGKTVEELQLSTTPNPKSEDRGNDRYATGLFDSGTDSYKFPKDDFDNYMEIWRAFPLVRESIRNYANEIVKDGYWVEAPSEEARDDLESWLEHAAIAGGEFGKDFIVILKKASIEREVLGTALSEKVRAEEDTSKLVAFMMIPPLSVKMHTRPNQKILLRPGDAGVDDAPAREDGKAAAYVQYDNGLQGFEGKKPIYFTVNDIIKITRDEGTGSLRGTSRLEAVYERVDALMDKLNANDEAVMSMAWKFWLLKFGTGEDGPWPKEDIKNFMQNHTKNDFKPGMKQGVQGDVDIQTVSGETADLEHTVETDINLIMTALPGPKYALGAFEADINQFVSRSQETRFQNQVEEGRNELEREFTPAIREKAEEMGYDPSEVYLRIGKSPEEREQELEEKAAEKEAENVGADGTSFTRPKASSEEEARENDSVDSQDEEEMSSYTPDPRGDGGTEFEQAESEE